MGRVEAYVKKIAKNARTLARWQGVSYPLLRLILLSGCFIELMKGMYGEFISTQSDQ